MIWVLWACTQETVSISTEKRELKSPEINGFDKECDPETDLWTFDIYANGWTSNGHVWMSDGNSTEKHYIQSIGAAADGSDDHLSLELEVVADWRDAESGKRTQFRCQHETDLSFLATVMHPETGSITDCVKSGSLDWTLIEGAPDCDHTLE